MEDDINDDMSDDDFTTAMLLKTIKVLLDIELESESDDHSLVSDISKNIVVNESSMIFLLILC